MIFIRNTVSSKILEKHIFLNDIKIIVKNANHNLRVICIFLNNVNQALDTYSKYDKDFLVGEFNREIEEQRIDYFLYMHELSKLQPFRKFLMVFL